MTPHLRLLSYLRPYRGRLVGALACMALLALATAAYAFLIGPLLAFLVTGDWRAAVPAHAARLFPELDPARLDRAQVLRVLPIALVAIALVKGAAYSGQWFLMNSIGQDVVADLRREMFAKLVRLPPAFYARRHTGDLHARLGLDVAHVENAIVWSLSSYVRDSLQVAVLLVQSFLLDWRLALIAFGAVPVTLFPVVRFARSLKRTTSRANEAMSAVTQATHETIAGIRVVQAFATEAQEQARFGAAVDRHLRVMRRSLLVRSVSTPTMEVIAVAGLGAAIAYAGGATASGALDGRVFMSFVATVMLMYQPAKSLGRVGQFLVQGLAGAERVFELLDEPVEIADRPGARDVPPISDRLEFKGVSFCYPGADGAARPVLRGVDLTVRRGEVVALVGASGSGKTTLANLVPRFYDVSGGAVSIDGVDVRDMTLRSLRAQLALVTQETLLFDDTVAANIAYGRPSATRAEVEAAARAADAHGFVSSLAQGYETVVGERGVMLSGGQRQRIAIARALLKDAPVLVLDEATSALDARSEAEVQAALERLMQDRTVLVIAHRLSTIRRATRIVVLREGRVVEEGAHEALLAAGGDYARLHALQQGPPAAAAGT